jgi:hypothetical protein
LTGRSSCVVKVRIRPTTQLSYSIPLKCLLILSPFPYAENSPSSLFLHPFPPHPSTPPTVLIQSYPILSASFHPSNPKKVALSTGQNGVYLWNGDWVDESGREGVAECVGVPTSKSPLPFRLVPTQARRLIMTDLYHLPANGRPVQRLLGHLVARWRGSLPHGLVYQERRGTVRARV